MRPVSTRFLESLRGSHRAATQVFVVAPGQTGTSPTGTEVSVISGNIQLDANASIRSTIDVSVDGTFPTTSDALLNVYGNELFIRRGIAFGGGTFEWVSLGYFRINSVEQDSPVGAIHIAGQDRMSGIVDGRLLNPVQYLSTDTYGDIIDELVSEVYPAAVIQWDDLTYGDAIGRSVIAEQERFDFLNDLVTSVGKIWYWDHRGVLVIKDVPPQDEPVWNVNAGENGVLISLSRDLSREGVYNAVVATGDALDTETPGRAAVVDDNPDSPTYYFGNFGKVPRFYSSPFITTDDQALSAATSLLTKTLGVPYNLDFTAVPNPALEPWDAVSVSLTPTRNPVAPRALITDGFNRTVADTWGTADSGEAWTASINPEYFDVAGTYGTVAFPSTNQARFNILSAIDEKDVEGYLVVSAPNVATGAALVMSAVTRYGAGPNLYSLAIEFNTGGAIACKIRRHDTGVVTEIASKNPVPGLTYTAGQHWTMKFRNYGTMLKMKVWPTGDAEPSSWTLETTDSTYKKGAIGVWAWRVSGNTNTGVQFQVHDYVSTTYNLPRDEVHVIERLTIPLLPAQAMTAETREQTLVVIGEV